VSLFLPHGALASNNLSTGHDLSRHAIPGRKLTVQTSNGRTSIPAASATKATRKGPPDESRGGEISIPHPSSLTLLNLHISHLSAVVRSA
jgi:hypothetical protein